MMLLSFALLAAAGYVSAQNEASTKAFTDPATGISFQAYTNAKGFKFGVALPKTGSKDLIGILSAPKGSSYAGGVLGPTMANTILVVAWPNGNTMMGSIRKVPEGKSPHYAPAEFSSDITLTSIAKGTFVAPSGDWQYTFVCNNCLDRKDVYPANATMENFAWALSTEPLKEPANKAGRLNHHHAGSGRFTADLTAARREEYPQWARLRLVNKN